jgi:hypothetical protein
MLTMFTYYDWCESTATPLPRLGGSAHKHSARPITAQKEKGSEELPGDVRQETIERRRP